MGGFLLPGKQKTTPSREARGGKGWGRKSVEPYSMVPGDGCGPPTAYSAATSVPGI
nr:MAG TPA: hypothetical protein [Caudoviricetes sp.]